MPSTPIDRRQVNTPVRGDHCLLDLTANVVDAVVHAQHVDLAHTTVRIRAGRRVDIRVRLPLDDDRCFPPGHQVIALIPPEAVYLETGLFRRSTQRLNRWFGRIVLVRPHGEGTIITAKVHGESWSLRSTRPIFGSNRPARTWDSVNIVVDPQAIELVSNHEN